MSPRALDYARAVAWLEQARAAADAYLARHPYYRAAEDIVAAVARNPRRDAPGAWTLEQAVDNRIAARARCLAERPDLEVELVASWMALRAAEEPYFAEECVT